MDRYRFCFDENTCDALLQLMQLYLLQNTVHFKVARMIYRSLVFAIAVCIHFSTVDGEGMQQVASSAWFDVECKANGQSATAVLQLCDELREELVRTWCGEHLVKQWTPRCKIRVHASRSAYLQRVGQNGGQTSGCSTIQLHDGEVVLREIDLLPNAVGELSALPHELTHVVLADQFRGKQPPHWFDEGVAMLADTVEKQDLHRRDCNHALASGTAIPLQQLTSLESFSSANEMAPFYGQSLTLVQMLCEKKSPRELVQFANDAQDIGLEPALKKHYSFQGWADLERAWKLSTLMQQQTQKSLVAVRFKP
jgi:hypothetical protein